MNYKLFLIVFFGLSASTVTKAQQMLNKDTFQFNDSTQVSVGQEILVNLPYNNSYDFINVKKSKGLSLGKISKIGNLGGAIGGTLGAVGIATGNVNAMGTAIDVMNAAEVASSVGITADAINSLNVSSEAKDIISKKLTIIKIEQKGSAKKGYAYSAIAVVSGTDNKYQLDLEPAIRTKEVLISTK